MGSKGFRSARITLIAFLALVPITLAALAIGRLMISPANIFAILFQNIVPGEPTWAAFEEAVIMNVRLPRIIMALLIGAGLSLAGASFQGLFANPLATPDTLGVGAGASFGSALGLLYSGNQIVIQLVSLAFGLGAIALTWTISKTRGSRSILMIVLSGSITGAFFQALISLVKYIADPETKLPAITYWLMGSIADVSFKNILIGAPLLLSGMGILIALRWRLNLLSLS